MTHSSFPPDQFVSHLFKAMRNFHGHHQTEFSVFLGITQGTISKVENREMNIHLELWFNFLRVFNIEDPYCFEYGGVVIPERSFESLETEGSRLAPKFKFSNADYLVEIRHIRPMHDYLVESHYKQFEAFLKENKISEEIFYILNHPLTFEFIDLFFGFLSTLKINTNSLALINLNFESSLGKFILGSKRNDEASNDELFQSFKNYFFRYEKIGSSPYQVVLNSKLMDRFSLLKNSDLVLQYGLLLPYHYLKSDKKIRKAGVVGVLEVEPHVWEITL